MTKQEIIAGLSELTDEADLSDVEKAIKTARAKLRKKDSHGWKTEGSDIDANPGSGESSRSSITQPLLVASPEPGFRTNVLGSNVENVAVTSSRGLTTRTLIVPRKPYQNRLVLDLGS